MALLSFKTFTIVAVVMLIVCVPSRAQEMLVEERYTDNACSGTVVKKSYNGFPMQCGLAGTWSGVSFWRIIYPKGAGAVTDNVLIRYYSDPNCTRQHTDTSSGPQNVDSLGRPCISYSTNPDVWRKFSWISNTSALLGLNIRIFSTPAQCSGATMMTGLYTTSLGCTPDADINGGRPIQPKSQLVTRMGTNGYSMVEYNSTYDCSGPTKTPASQFTCDCSCGSFSGLGMQSWSCGNTLTPSPAPSCLAPSSTPMPTPSTPSTPTVDGAPKLETCLDVKKEFQRQGCCGTPTKMFNKGDMGMKSGGRRLSQDTLIDNVKLLLEEAKRQGGASHARSMTAELIGFVEKAALKAVLEK